MLIRRGWNKYTDAIRDELLAKGVAIKDTREGVKWELV